MRKNERRRAAPQPQTTLTTMEEADLLRFQLADSQVALAGAQLETAKQRLEQARMAFGAVAGGLAQKYAQPGLKVVNLDVQTGEIKLAPTS